MIESWQALERKEVFSKFGKKIDEVTFLLPNGKKDLYYIKNEEPTVCIFSITHNHQVILAKQYRPGPQKVLLELPGGGIEKDENPLQAAKRELFEETGFMGDMKFVTTAYDCAYSTRIRYCFIATDCTQKGKQQLDDNEFITVEKVSLTAFRKLLRKGAITDIEVGYLALDFLDLL